MNTFSEEQTAEFKKFETNGWNNVARDYHELWGDLAFQAARELVKNVKINPIKVLDIATGAGYVASLISKETVSVVGIDISEAQVELARKTYPTLNFVVGDMENIPFKNESFDLVTMNLGLLHTLEPEKVLAEVNRVLKPEGRFVFSVWSNPNKSIGMKILLDAISNYGDPSVKMPAAQPYFRFSDSMEVEKYFKKENILLESFKESKLEWKFKGPKFEDKLFDAFYIGAVRTTELLNRQTIESQIQIKEYMKTKSLEYLVDDKTIHIPMSVSISTGKKRF